MEPNDCESFRIEFESDQPLSEVQAHLNGCDACRSWHAQTVALISASEVLPQYDVPEALTQRIMAEVRESQSEVRYQFLLPVATVCGALMLTIMPVDSTEGWLSSALSMAAIAVIYFLVDGAKSEEVVA